MLGAIIIIMKKNWHFPDKVFFFGLINVLHFSELAIEWKKVREASLP